MSQPPQSPLLPPTCLPAPEVALEESALHCCDPLSHNGLRPDAFVIDHCQCLQEYLKQWTSQYETFMIDLYAAAYGHGREKFGSSPLAQMNSTGGGELPCDTIGVSYLQILEDETRSPIPIRSPRNKSLGSKSPTSKDKNENGLANRQTSPQDRQTSPQLVNAGDDVKRAISNTSHDRFGDKRALSHLVESASGAEKSTAKGFLSSIKHAAVKQRLDKDSIFARIIHDTRFELLCGLTIIVNSITIGYVANYNAHHLDQPDPPSFFAMEISFAFFYTFELILRIYVNRYIFFTGYEWKWNVFDMIIVGTTLFDILVKTIINPNAQGSNVTFMRLLRLLKMFKMLRMVRMMRMFKELRLIMGSLLASASSMFWSIVVIALCTYMFGICFLQATTDYLKAHDEQVVEDELTQLRFYWGSLSTAMISLFMASSNGESWIHMSRALRHVGEAYFVIFVLYIIFFMFAIMNMFTSLYVETTREQGERDAADLIQAEMHEHSAYISKFYQLFTDVDGDGSGDLSMEEFNEQVKNEAFLALMSGLGIEIHDAMQFFDILSDRGQHLVDVETFLTGCMRMKGAAKSIDLLALSHAQRKAAVQQARFIDSVEKQFAKLAKSLPHK